MVFVNSINDSQFRLVSIYLQGFPLAFGRAASGSLAQNGFQQTS